MFAKDLGSLHDLNAESSRGSTTRLRKGGLMGKAPGDVFAATPPKPDELDEAKLRRALTVRKCDAACAGTTTLAMDGTGLHFLAGRLVTVARSSSITTTLCFALGLSPSVLTARIRPTMEALRWLPAGA